MINSTRLPVRTTTTWAAILLTIAAALLFAQLKSPETAQAQEPPVCYADDMKAKVYIEGPDGNEQQYDTTDDLANVSANALALQRGPEGISINYTLVFSGEYITSTEDGPCKDQAAPTKRAGFQPETPYENERVGGEGASPIPEAWVELIFNDGDGRDTTATLPPAIMPERIAVKGQEADWGGRDLRGQPHNIGETEDPEDNAGGIPLRQPVGMNVRPGNNDMKYLVANLVTYTTASYNTDNKVKKVLATTYIKLEGFPDTVITYTPVPATGDKTPLTLTEGGGITNDQGSVEGFTIDLLTTGVNPIFGDPGASGKDTTLSHTFWLESSCTGTSEIGRVELPTEGDVIWKLDQVATQASFGGTLSRLTAFDDSLWERTEELCLHGGIKAVKGEDIDIQYSTMTTNPLTLEDNEPDPSLTLELGPDLDELAEGKYTVEARSQADTDHQIRYRAALRWDDDSSTVPEYPVIFTMSVLDGTAVLGTHYGGEHVAGEETISWTVLSDANWNGQVDEGLSFSGKFDLTALGITGQGPSHELEIQAAIAGSGADPVRQTIAMVNSAPTFPSEETGMREISEIPGAGTVENTARNVGDPVDASDNDTLTYTLGGDDAASFEIVESSGQLTTKIGTSYDYEAKASYELTVTAGDGTTTTEQTVTVNLTDVNDAPVFTDGDSTMRSVPENSGASVNVGNPVSATDQDRDADGNQDTLTYTLGGTDASSFEIDEGTGQLTTKSGVNYDYENNPSYSVTVGVGDGTDNESIAVTVNLTDANDAPVFTEGESAVRSVPENSGASVNVGAAVSATDQDRNPADTLAYTLGGTDAGSFEIVESSGQLTTKQGVSYDLETKASYSVTVTATDPDSAADSIAVTINLTDVNDAPVFTEGDSTTRSLAENTAAGENVGLPLTATDQDNDTLAYTLSGTDADSFEIDGGTGQLTTKQGVSYDLETKASYSVTVTATDPDRAADSIAVTVNLTDVNDAPVFTEGESAVRSLAENTAAGENVGLPVAATDQDRDADGNQDTLTYTLSGTDADSFEIDGGTGQLTTKQGVSYDLEAKASYSVTVTATDPDSAADAIAVTVNLTDVNDAPVFTEGESATRSVPENSGASVNVGNPVAATDQDNDALTYTLSGTDAASFEIDGATGQLQTKEGVAYDLETKASYSVTVTVTDPDSAADAIAVTVNLTDVNDAPVFAEGESATRSLAENSGANVDVGNPLSATDQDNDALTYTLSGTDAASFEIDGATGQLQTKEGVSYDLEAKASYSVTVTATDPDNAADSIAVTVNLTDANDAPVFTEGDSTTRSLAENTAAGENVGLPISATDQDNDTLAYTLSGTDADSFEIVESSGQLTTKSGVSYDLEAKASYSVTVTATDPDNAADSIAVTVNLTDVNDAPVFTEGESATRSVPENSGANVNVGAAVSATDQDGDTLAYTLSGTDAGSFEIDGGTGQLTTVAGVTYDYEAKQTYSLTVEASDPEGASASISVTVNLTDANDPPVFDEGTGATRSLAENTAAGENIGAPLTARDQDGDTLTYTLSGADAGSFDLNAATGQLTIRESVTYDYEAKQTYSLSVTSEDPEGARAFIDVTVNLVESQEAAVNNAPFFDAGPSAAFSLAENSAAGTSVGLPLTATDQDGDTLTYSLSGTDAGSFEIDAASGQLLTREGRELRLRGQADLFPSGNSGGPGGQQRLHRRDSQPDRRGGSGAQQRSGLRRRGQHGTHPSREHGGGDGHRLAHHRYRP